MDYSQDMETRRLFDYISLGESAILNVANSIVDNKHNDFLSDVDIRQPSIQMTTDLVSMIKLKNALKRSIDASVVTEREVGLCFDYRFIFNLNAKNHFIKLNIQFTDSGKI
jgi:hypothetical protein